MSRRPQWFRKVAYCMAKHFTVPKAPQDVFWPNISYKGNKISISGISTREPTFRFSKLDLWPNARPQLYQFVNVLKNVLSLISLKIVWSGLINFSINFKKTFLWKIWDLYTNCDREHKWFLTSHENKSDLRRKFET